MTDILTGTPPDLTYLHPFVRGLAGGLGHHVGRFGGDPGLDGAELHRPGTSRKASVGLAGDGAPLGAGPHRRRISLWWCALVIDVAHAVSQFIAVPWTSPPAPCCGRPWSRC